MRILRIHKYSTNLGFSLTEVMISLLITVLLTAALLQFLTNTTKNFRNDRNISELSQNGSLAMNFLVQSIHLAGFRDIPNFKNMQSYDHFNDLFPIGSEFIQGTYQKSNNGDSITVRYQGSISGNIFDCLGEVVPPGQTAINRFYITTNNELACQASINGIPNPNSPGILAEGVDAMVIRFGEDLNQDGVVDRFVNADFPELNFNLVKSVKISLLMRTKDSIKKAEPSKQYVMQDSMVGPYADGRFRRVFTTTINIRTFLGDT